MHLSFMWLKLNGYIRTKITIKLIHIPTFLISVMKIRIFKKSRWSNEKKSNFKKFELLYRIS